jgi:hypothetical protein
MEAGSVMVIADPVRDQPGQFVLVASIPLARRPTLTVDGLRVPVAPRREAEAQIETATDTMAVAVASDAHSRMIERVPDMGGDGIEPPTPCV